MTGTAGKILSDLLNAVLVYIARRKQGRRVATVRLGLQPRQVRIQKIISLSVVGLFARKGTVAQGIQDKYGVRNVVVVDVSDVAQSLEILIIGTLEELGYAGIGRVFVPVELNNLPVPRKQGVGQEGLNGLGNHSL